MHPKKTMFSGEYRLKNRHFTQISAFIRRCAGSVFNNLYKNFREFSTSAFSAHFCSRLQIR